MKRDVNATLKINRSRKRAADRPAAQLAADREFDRDAALAKAMETFWRLGYEATTMADLRGALGITQASLYAAFGKEELLFREAVDLYLRTAGTTTVRALANQPTARESIRAMLHDAARSFTTAGLPAGCLVVLGTMNCTPESKPVQDYLHSLRLRTPRAISERIKRGQREGDVCAGRFAWMPLPPTIRPSCTAFPSRRGTELRARLLRRSSNAR